MSETSARLLKLLSLLQTPREWPGPELASRLEVSERTVRHDIERLRGLGYPVEATRGRIGGYRLAAGQAMPPLLLDDEEAVAVAVALRTATGAGISGLEETALQALTKLQQVLPARLRHQVDVLQSGTVEAPPAPWASRAGGPRVDASVLTSVAKAAYDREILRFGYAAHSGDETERRVEPYRLVRLGRRWYLVAFDLHRDDWRTFRVDRATDLRGVGHRFTSRPLPAADLGAYVAHKTRQVQQKVVGTVEFAAAADLVEQKLGGWNTGVVEVLGPERCRVGLAGRSVDQLAFWLGIVGVDFRVVDSPELASAVARLGERYARATAAQA